MALPTSPATDRADGTFDGTRPSDVPSTPVAVASLKKRGSSYSVTFTQRDDAGSLVQKTYGLGVSRKDQAERLKSRYEDQYRMGEINPFDGSWSPKMERQLKPVVTTGVSLREAGDRFLASRSHVRGRTRSDYESQLDRLIERVGGGVKISV